MSKSNGYEDIAAAFIKIRGNSTNTIGISSVQKWAETLPISATVLDLGCANGFPVSKVLIDQKLQVFGIDASQTLADAFKANFPNCPITCEAIEESSFFDMQFDAIIVWGLLFLLSPEIQKSVLQKIAHHLKPGGKLLFTSPSQTAKWQDALTGLTSESLGTDTYRKILSENGFTTIDEYTDEGGNNYYDCVKD